MSRVIDTEGLADVRGRLLALEDDFVQHRHAVQVALAPLHRPDPTWRLEAVTAWIALTSQDLAHRIDAVRLTEWLRQKPGSGIPPSPVTRWDAIRSTLAAPIAAEYLRGLPLGEQQLIARWRPASVARLPGAPLSARAEANRVQILREVKRIQKEIATVEASLADFPASSHAYRWRKAQVAELREHQQVMTRLAARHPIWFESGEDGRYLEWIGPEDAHHVVLFVPGTGHSLWTADDLAATGRGLQRSAAGLTDDPVAVVIAMGYDAPNHIPAAGSGGYAHRAAAELSDRLDSIGLHQERHVTLLGHSYGSYAATSALAELDSLRVDELVLIGSPGVGTDSVHELPIASNRVWAGLTDNDPITLTSADRWMTWLERLDSNPFDWRTWDVQRDGTYEQLWFGTNPAHPAFGAQRLEMFEADGHSGYFGDGDPRGLENLARVFVGIDPVLDG